MHEKFREFWATVSFFPTYIPENITRLFLFQHLTSLFYNRDIKSRSLELTKHHIFHTNSENTQMKIETNCNNAKIMRRSPKYEINLFVPNAPF